MEDIYTSVRVIDRKLRKVIVDKNENIINKNPSKEELRGLEKAPYTKKERRYTEEELLEHLRQFYDDNGRVPVCNDFDSSHKYPSHKNYAACFGSWDKAIDIAGLLDKRKVIRDRYTDKKLLEYLIQFYKENERPPVRRDFIDNPTKYPGFYTYVRHFGGWSKALKLVELDVDSMVKKGIIKTCQQKARLFEMIILERPIMKGCIDISGDNFCSPVDGICPKGQIYDAKSIALLKDRCWPFDLNKRGKVDFYYLGAFDKDYKNLLYVWIIPEDFTDEDHIVIGIDSDYKYNIENMKKCEITDKFKDIDLFKQ